MGDEKSIRELQRTLPWGAHEYNGAFQARTDPQRDAQHALIHVAKAAGRIADILDECDHVRDPAEFGEARRADAQKYLADLLICAARIANRWPGGAVDLQDAVAARLREKFGAGVG